MCRHAESKDLFGWCFQYHFHFSVHRYNTLLRVWPVRPMHGNHNHLRHKHDQHSKDV